jgi:2-dehydro-3-deoxyphosphogluconate aldolase/(4S)-4-hydroxy-2-oxoglutarate aldolase
VGTVFDELSKIGIIPVVKIDDPRRALDLAGALTAGGIPCMEITLRTSQGLAAIGKIAGVKPEFLLGAGTVLTVEQAEAALSAGARFIVSPGLDPALARRNSAALGDGQTFCAAAGCTFFFY